ncbi:MAG: SPOR domain-containing protein [Geobacter sp.]|nr:SPOR domain-containing protein [Geobacter sp.]
MVLDYRERKPVTKNKPKRQPVGIFGLVILVAVLVSYALGVASGWFAHRYRASQQAAAQAAAAAIGAPDKPAAATDPRLGTAPPTKGGEVPLTFYETLPKGQGGVVIGSGINPRHPEQPPAPAVKPAPPTVPPASTSAPQAAQKPAAPPAPPTPQPADKAAPQSKPSAPVAKVPAPATKAPVPAAKAPATPVKQDTAATKPASTGDTKRYAVQVASYRERKEAETIRGRLAAMGQEAYIVEVRVPEKGVWYRVNAGKHLRKQEAQELATKLGSGAVPIPE